MNTVNSVLGQNDTVLQLPVLTKEGIKKYVWDNLPMLQKSQTELEETRHAVFTILLFLERALRIHEKDAGLFDATINDSEKNRRFSELRQDLEENERRNPKESQPIIYEPHSYYIKSGDPVLNSYLNNYHGPLLYFFTYIIDNNLKLETACLENLITRFLSKDFNIPATWRNCNSILEQFLCNKEDFGYRLTDKSSIEIDSLLTKYPAGKAVFLAESSEDAKALECRTIEAFQRDLFFQLLSAQGGNLDDVKNAEDLLKHRDGISFREILNQSYRWDYSNRYCALAFLRIFLEYNANYDIPSGNVCWCAPRNGYAAPWSLDWTSLHDRPVYIFKRGTPDSPVVLRQLLELCNYIPYNYKNPLYFVIFPDRVSPRFQDYQICFWEPKELFIRCRKMHVPIPSYLKSKVDLELRDTKNSAQKFVLYPFLKRDSWCLLTGNAGTGKTYLGLLLGMAIASHGKLFQNWRVCPRGLKVLYIADSEMDDEEINTRLQVLGRVYRRKDFFWETVSNVNITEESGQNKIRELITSYVDKGSSKPVSVVFLDHLLKLTDAEGDQKEPWKKVRAWITALNEEHITIVLLHHEYAEGKIHGTHMIINDTPACIRIAKGDREEKNAIVWDIQLTKNRFGRDGEKPFTVTLSLDSPKSFYEDNILKDDSSTTWHKLKKTEKEKILENIRTKIETRTIQQIADAYQCHKNTIEKALQKYREELRNITSES